MKQCRKLLEPATLTNYRAAQPDGTWDAMKNDPHHDGQQAYYDIKATLVCGQRGLCAYCERRITKGLTEAELAESRAQQQVEHFHPKNDVSGPVNWALHWPNLWAVCTGGSRVPAGGGLGDPADYLPPLPENLSCDAFKDHQIQTGQLPQNPEGWVLAPQEVPPFPRLFQYAPDGSPEPDAETCSEHIVAGNQHPDTATLVAETIKHLNLSCVRLNRLRHVARQKLRDMIRQLREKYPRGNPRELLLGLARRLLSSTETSVWAEFFTLVRWVLGAAGEEHLQQIGYTG